MEETELAPNENKFRQGDIIKLYGVEHADYGVIINADCDLANNKTDGHIAYIPLFSFQDFINRFWFGDEVKTIRKQCENNLLRYFDSATEVQELAEWLAKENPDIVFDALSSSLALKKQSDADDLERLVKKLHVSIHDNGLCALRKIYSLEKNPEKHAETQLGKLRSNLGEGHMMISSVVGLSDLGFVLRMKRIFSIDESSCYKLMSKYLIESPDDKSIAAVRIARLTPTYKYKAAQVFANSFSRIGLSDEITRLNDLAILDVVQNLRSVSNV